MDYVEKVIQIIAKSFDIDPTSLSADTDILEDLDVDSIDLVELVMDMEEEFSIEIEDEVLANLHTIGDVAEELERLDA